MNPDELRALADTLLPMAAAPCFDGIDVERAAAYLRAQADAHPAPVAPQAEPFVPHARCKTPDKCRRDGVCFDAWACSSGPAPQAEPKREPKRDERIDLPDYLRLQIAGTAAAHDVLVERRRQIEVEGWTPEHDDQHGNWELSRAAVCYGNMGRNGPFSHPHPAHPPLGWPWHWTWWKLSDDPRRNLVKAGALILAEIERLDRMGGSDGN